MLWCQIMEKSTSYLKPTLLYFILCMTYNTVKPVLRGHPREDKKWLLKTGDPLIQVRVHCILGQGTQKRWLLKTGDPLIEVTT